MITATPPPTRYRDLREPTWTPRQREVLDLLVRGRTNAQIADALGISLDGAKWHVSEVITKLGVDSREEAAEYWRARNGLRLRFTRALRALLPGAGWLKVGGALAAVAAGYAAVIAVVAFHESGAGDGRALADATPPAATAASTTAAVVTPQPSSPSATGIDRDGPDGFRSFAREVQSAWDRNDTAFFIQRMKGTSTPCTASDVGLKSATGNQLCRAAGDSYLGFLSGPWRSEWETVPLDTAFQTLTDISESDQPSATDRFGSGEMRIHSLNVSPGDFRIIGTAIVRLPVANRSVGPARLAVALTAVFESGRWQFTSLLNAQVLAEDLLTPGTEFTSKLAALEPFQRGAQPTVTAAAQSKCPTTTLACQAADDFARFLRFSDFDSMFKGVEATPMVCPGPEANGLGGPYPLCNGAPAGQLRNGFPVTLHGSEGEVLSAPDFRSLVTTSVGDPKRLRLRAIGCDASKGCERFVVIFEITGQPQVQPQVVYFVFTARPVPGVPVTARLAGLGRSGDNAEDILALKPTTTGVGATSFLAYAGLP